ncbi:hypothetical protein ES332_D01G249800v1 [Gossypium tomentosum]|uniref:Uncharacterized protein n=1 Tax=Gossypium tomentosum TaxID=34277 RepID=A0A5D2MDD5_GOSTO|nr:hypothetical protein ES332_D01G249800v1 [Gossypium tomentosum]
MQLTRIPYSPNSPLKLLANPTTACFDRMHPFWAGTITRAACLAPKKPPTTLTSRTFLKLSPSEAMALNSSSPAIPALLNMISSLSYLKTAKSTAFWTSVSHVTSQWM